jgi:uncharacterized integral membrane protein (TIGR00698 family)
MQHGLRLLPGTALAGVIALAATFVASLHGGPQLLYALMFGVAFNYLSGENRTRPGIEFSGRVLLRFGVGLLGARITAAQIVGLGWETALTVVAAAATTVLCGLAVSRWLRMSRAQGVLSGGAVAICGASAALAISAVLPRDKGTDRFTLVVVVTVTVMSTLAMILYPLIARILSLPPPLAGLFLGGTIHDVAQVVGAGYMLGQDAGDSATIVKLFRVSLLTVVVVIVSAAFKGERQRALPDSDAAGGEPGRQALVPWFLWMFIVMVALNSMGALSLPVQSAASAFSRACLVVAIAALGIKTSFNELARLGWRPLALIAIETVWIAAFVLAVVVWGR